MNINCLKINYNMRRIIIALFFFLVAGQALAGEGPDEIKFTKDGIHYKVENGYDFESGIVSFFNVSVSGIAKNLNSVIIPSKVIDADGIEYSVVSIESKAFINNINLTYIIIPKTVMKIGDNAFKGCSNLLIFCEAKTKPKGWSESWNPDGCSVVWECNEQELHQGDSLYYNVTSNTNQLTAEVGYHPFHLKYTTITIPKEILFPEYANNKLYAVTGIGKYAFYGCDKLEFVTIPNSVEYIGSGAFAECSSLKSITIPNSVKNIDTLAFYECGGLETVTIPKSVTNIGLGAFADCESLKEINVENGNTEYKSENGVLFDKDKSTLICCPAGKSGKYDIPSGVTSIYVGAFSECGNLTSLTIPDKVAEIGDDAFSGCTGLTSLTIPNSVTYIGEFAFDSCINLKSVIIPVSVISIGDSLFSNCSNLTIYCEAESEPDEWKQFDWNPDNRPVVWGYNSNENQGNENNNSENQNGEENNNGENQGNENTNNGGSQNETKPQPTTPEGIIAHHILDIIHNVISFVTDVDEDDVNEVIIYAYDKMVVVENAEITNGEIEVFDINGRMVAKATANSSRVEIPMKAQGVYIVRVGNVAKRVVVN